MELKANMDTPALAPCAPAQPTGAQGLATARKCDVQVSLQGY